MQPGTPSRSPSHPFAARLQAASVGCAAITAGLSAVALLGWIVHAPILERWAPGLPTMKANVAICFLLVSVSLLAHSRSAPRSGLRRAAAACAAVVVLVGAATLAEYAFGWKLGIDQLLFGDHAGANAPDPDRPAENTALGLVAVGASLLFWDVRSGRFWFSDPPAWGALALGMLALIGYATGAAALIELSAHQQIALSSAAALLLVSIGSLLARPQHGPLALLASDGQGGVHRFGRVGQLTARRRAAQKLRGLLESAPDAILVVNAAGEIVVANARVEAVFGYARDELIGQSIDLLVPERLRSAHPSQRERFFAAPRVRQVEPGLDPHARRRDGSEFPAEITLNPIQTDDGLLVSAAIRDVTERRSAEDATARLAAIVESCEDAIIMLSSAGVIESWNAAAERLYGFPASEVIGRSHAMLWFCNEPTPAAGFAAGLAGDTITIEGQALRRDGGSFDCGVTVSPVRKGDAVVGVSCIVRDITERKSAERELKRLAQAAEHGSDAVVSIDVDQHVRRWNRGAERLYGFTAEEAIGRSVHDLNDAAGAGQIAYDRAREAILGILAGESAYQVETRQPRKDGTIIDVLLTVSPWLVDGRVVGMTTIALDLSERKRVERARERALADLEETQGTLRDAEERFRRAFDEAPIGMALISADGRLEQANAALGAISGRTRDELSGMHLRELLHPADADSGSAALRALAAGDVDQIGLELRFIPVVGSPLHVSVRGTLLRYAAGERHLLCQFQDVTERKRFEAQLQFMADHDPLTGLQNRRKFEAELDRHVDYVKRYGPEGALLVLDIDNFKSVNDTLGHNAGDELIVSIASILRQRVRQSDVLARLGGDEFALLLPRADEAEATRVAEALVRAVSSSTTLLGGERKSVTTSIGVAMFNTNVEGLSGETILIEADLAMYDAKEAGRDGFALYATTEHRISRTQARLTWVSRMERAFAENRFQLLAQPILDLQSGQVRQHELLIRMLDDDGDLIPPASFLYIAERFGLIARLDEWVAGQAIGLIEQRPELQLEVNISGRSLGDRKLLGAIDERLRTSGIDPVRLIFEVTETAAVANITHAQAFAQHLRDHGCRFALDDFGAGFGSFYYLKHLPFDYVKIDGEFVQHATSGHIDQLVIEAVVRVARGLGKETIAEFVVDEKTLRMVTRLGVDYAQGYHVGKPVPVAGLLGSSSSSDSYESPPAPRRPL